MNFVSDGEHFSLSLHSHGDSCSGVDEGHWRWFQSEQVQDFEALYDEAMLRLMREHMARVAAEEILERQAREYAELYNAHRTFVMASRDRL